MEDSLTSYKFKDHVLTLIDMGEQARRQGDFSRARRLFRAALRESLPYPHNNDHIVLAATSLATSYFDETNYDRAQAWFKRALHISISLYGEHTLQAGCLLVKLANLSVLKSKLDEYEMYLEHAQRTYLLCDSKDVRLFLDCLIDLSWTLCVMNRASDAMSVNQFIAQIKQEETLSLSFITETIKDHGIEKLQ